MKGVGHIRSKSHDKYGQGEVALAAFPAHIFYYLYALRDGLPAEPFRFSQMIFCTLHYDGKK